MDEKKKYTSLCIPQCEVQRSKEALSFVQTGPTIAVSFADADFTEIEYEFNANTVSAGEKERRPFSSASLAQPIGQRIVDPIREKFYKMRSLASDNPFARSDAGLFYKQAKFMEDYSDNYQGSVQFSMYYPYYQHMGYEQLRTYFTWRTKARCGEILPTSVSYVFLYIYELLSGIGVRDPVDGLDKLMTIWNMYRKYEPELDNYLTQWLKDYHIYYDLPHSFTDFLYEHCLQNYYPELFLFDDNTQNRLVLWNIISSYDVTKSKFYKAGNKNLIEECFDFVLCDIHELCINQNIQIEELFSLGIKTRYHWYPFQRALFFNRFNQQDRTVEITGGEKYFCKDNCWTANTVIHKNGRKELAGYLLKKTEACLRKVVGYKFKIDANPGMFAYDFKKLGIPLEKFDKVIEKAVMEFYRNKNRTVVTVDYDNLARIRKEALGTQDKLIVPENDVPSAPAAIWTEQDAAPFTKQGTEQPVAYSDRWNDFKEALNVTERKALSILLHGGTSIKAFADESGVMLEVLMDNINEKAADHIGDNILEMNGSITIYDEYRESIVENIKT